MKSLMKINPGYYYGYMDFRIWFFMHNKVFKIKLKINETEKALVINPEEEELNMVNSFIASFFTFSLTLFVLLICLAIGNVISSKILTSLLAK